MSSTFVSPAVPTRRGLLRAAFAGAVVVLLAASWPQATWAAGVEDAVADIQREWEVIRYQSPPKQREQAYEALAAKAHQTSERHAGRSEPLVWEGIVVSSWAGEKGGLGALGLVKRAKALYEEAIRIDGNVLDGSAYNSLGVLYYKVPGWPVGFGDKAKAGELLQKALAIAPAGIDANYFYAEYLVETKRAAEAAPFLDRVLKAPPRPGRPLADAGRREEARLLLEQVRTAP